MTVLVIAEHLNQVCDPNVACLVTAAKYCHEIVHVAVIGQDCQAVAQTCAQLEGVAQVFLVEHAYGQRSTAEVVTAAVLKISQSGTTYTHILADSGSDGKNSVPRIAALLQCEALTDVISIHEPTIFSRPIYAGNAIEKVKVNAALIPMTVRANRFKRAAQATAPASITMLSLDMPAPVVTFVKLEAHSSDRPDLKIAKIVVAGGRGLQSKQQFALVEQLADALKAAVGASRAAVDAGFVPNEYQVGQTGKTVAPELYIALGISGAIQHVAGIKDSKVIVAINNDPNAPIFEVADVGLVADLFTAVPEFIALVEQTSSNT